MRRAGVEPTTSSARTSPRCLRGGPRRSLYTLTCTLTSSISSIQTRKWKCKCSRLFLGQRGPAWTRAPRAVAMVARTRAASAKAGGPHGHGGDDDGGFLVERLAFYESYHSNAANKVIHVICIPLIVWSVLVALRLVTFSVPNVTGFEANFGLLTIIAYGMFYLAADKSAGFTW